ncbi:protease inhibitor I42 family protein [Streptomyces lavendulae]|uniref:protease inhibitor I42 family protein n=1 Tax=Streptomyces lavendulae TaxID=1914 RepID=UPI0024A482AC|nr:protease inhibitor I42 family protein [Streptomyces lavendulae]GLX19656.1 hypothetical protein Slala01_33000 [Streptomyces lavendulae subsp. lavendulae]GLX27151.1 hypothetical protein Slala02_29710 [Streptomyces lavendulae subsp. lavendulae]
MISQTRTTDVLRRSRGGAAIPAITVAAVLALTAGCDSGVGASGGRATSRPVKDTSITAEPGERFTLTVGQNASTREYWYLVDPEPDRSVLLSRGQAYAADSGAEKTAGAGGRLTFTFEAKGKGTTRFTLLHCTFTTCQGNTASLPPATTGPATTGPATTGPATTGPSTTGPSTTGPATTGPSAVPTTAATPPAQAPERITYTVTVG